MGRLKKLAKRWVLRGGKLMAVLVLMGFSMFGLVPSRAHADVNISGPQNCDSNAVIYCGATSASQVVSKYTNGDGRNSAASIQNIFGFFGITADMVQSMPTTAVEGSVTSSGQVFVNGQQVASGATTGGRQNISGSTAVTSNGTTFYTRPPSVSFTGSPLSAFVVMSGGQFQFAVLASCGNPIKATATPQTPAPAPKPTTPATTTPAPTTPAPMARCITLGLLQTSTNPPAVEATAQVSSGASVNNVSFDWGDNSSPTTGSATTASHTYQSPGTYTIKATVSFNEASTPSSTCQSNIVFAQSAAPTPTPTATPAVQTTPAAPPSNQLVNTGPGSTAEVAGIFVATSVAGYFGYRIYLSRRLG